MPVSNEEIICTWMEPKPTMSEAMAEGWAFRWWGRDRKPCRQLDLDALREVQERLTDEQWADYEDGILNQWSATADRYRESTAKFCLHATPEQKIAALGSVLRPIVEGRK
jgi:hypothetical protein